MSNEEPGTLTAMTVERDPGVSCTHELARLRSQTIWQTLSRVTQRNPQCGACIMSRSVTGTQALMWGSDYPHHEGTFPRSREVLARLFDGIDIGEQDKADIVGANAGRLFRVPRPEFLHAA